MSKIKDLLPEVKIETYYIVKPLPVRDFDWSAIDINSYDGQANDPVGYGKTKEEAISDLVDQLIELVFGD